MSDTKIVAQGRLVILRQKRMEDAHDDYAWRIDEELSSLDATVPIRLSFEEFSRFFREEVEYPSRWSRRFSMDTLDGQHIGNCMYYDIDLVKKQTELGIMVGNKAYWSQGYGQDAVTLLADYVFAENAIELIYLHTLEWNHRARRSFAKSGFKEVREVRRGRYDFIRMEITREQWESRIREN